LENIDYNKPFTIRDRRNGEWYWVQKEILSSEKIKPSAKLVYSALAYYANNKSQIAFPSATTISKLIKLNRDTVFSALKELKENNFIDIKKSSGKCNNYILLRVVGISDQYENKDYTRPSFPAGVVGNKDTNNTKEQYSFNNINNLKKTTNYKALKLLRKSLQDKKIIK